MSDLRLAPRFTDEVWKIEFDWTPWLGSAAIAGQPTVQAVGSGFTIGTVSTSANVTTFLVSGGAADNTARIALLAVLDNGEKPGFNILAPIKAR